ncbi:MAG: hypothetical protein Aurels2KO_45460 [Aureliella sp.]
MLSRFVENVIEGAKLIKLLTKTLTPANGFIMKSTFQIFALSLVCGFALSALAGIAQAQSVPLPDDTKLLVQLDLQEFSKTSIGARLVELTAETAAKEMDTDGEQLLAKVNKSLGFDPLSEVRTITVATSSIDDPNHAIASGGVVVQLGKTTGNLEGLMLALPGYKSSEHGDQTLHSAGEGSQRATCAIHASGNGNHTLLLARDSDHVAHMLDTMEAAGTQATSSDATAMALSPNVFARVVVLDVPVEKFEDEPLITNVMGLIQKASVEVSEVNRKTMHVQVNVIANKEKKAEQIRQLLAGASAAAGLLLDSVDELDADGLREVAEDVLQSIKVTREEKVVGLSLDIPSEVLADFLREEADLPL